MTDEFIKNIFAIFAHVLFIIQFILKLAKQQNAENANIYAHKIINFVADKIDHL